MQTTAGERQQSAAQQPASRGEVVLARPRLPYPTGVDERFGVDRSSWKALVEAVFPLARSPDAVVLALAYCKARNLDPFKRVVHIVPMWNSALNREVETVWPGVAEHRITAFRTKQYAGADPAEFGPTRTDTFKGENKQGAKQQATCTYPEWCQVTVYRLIDGQRIAFPGPRVYFAEWFSQRKGAPVPNERWTRAPFQMIEKCAEAAALRKAFPEELGDEPTADEMAGKIIDPDGNVLQEHAPPRPKRTDFADPAEQRFIEATESGEFTGDVAAEIAAETVDPDTGEVNEGAEGKSPDPSTNSANVYHPPADRERATNEANTTNTPADDEFWSRDSYEIAPRKKGSSYLWPEWEAAMLDRARTLPGLMAGGKLRANNAKWLTASAQWNPGHQKFVAEFDRLTVPATDGEG